MEELSSKVTIIPRFRDIDMLGHVNNAVIVTYLEVCRSNWYRREVGDPRFRKFSFLLARTEIDYLSPIFLQSRPVIELRVCKISKKSWEFCFEIFDQNSGTKFARAKNVLVRYDIDQKISLELTREEIALLEKFRK